jgi:hypothetical protein
MSEQGFADNFNEYMRRAAVQYTWDYHRFSVGSQDRDVGGDYVISDSDRFALIEFKHTEDDCVSENRKPRRLKLCHLVAERRDMRNLHDQCHFIAWTDSATEDGRLNIYRNEVCNESVFGTGCGLNAEQADESTRIWGADFAEEFLRKDSVRSVSREDFEAYVEWVMRDTSGASKSTLTLLALDPHLRRMKSVRLQSLAEVYQWMQDHQPPPPSNGPSHNSGPSSGP